MSHHFRRLVYLTPLCVPLAFGCSSSDGGNSSGPGGATSAAGTGAGTAGTGGAATSTAGTTGNTAGMGTSGGGGSSTGGTATAGTAGTAAGGAATGGSPGTAGAAGTAGTGGGVRTGMSVGCNTVPPGEDSSDNYVLHEVTIDGLDPTYLQGGEDYDSSGPYDYSFRPYGVRLPKNYDPSVPYAVTFGGGGCGGSAQGFASGPGGGLQIAGNGNTIQVGLSYIAGCFSDGGPSISNRTDSPEEPYFRAVMADIEAHYCIDLSQVFVSGFSSGAWEAYTLGCAAADLIRGVSADEGGMRDMHPECKGPVAAVLVAGEADTENPIGPLDDVADEGTINRLGSHGSAPGRDDILERNGCVGTETAPVGNAWDPDSKYGECVTYTGCPEAYPVVWCALPGVGHNNSTYNGTNYSPGLMWNVLGSLPAP